MYHHELIVGQLDSMMFRGCVLLIQLHCSLLMVYEYEVLCQCFYDLSILKSADESSKHQHDSLINL